MNKPIIITSILAVYVLGFYGFANPSAGSGTPVLSADGVLGASAISAAVFGGIAGALFFKAKNGKYAAQGRG